MRHAPAAKHHPDVRAGRAAVPQVVHPVRHIARTSAGVFNRATDAELGPPALFRRFGHRTQKRPSCRAGPRSLRLGPGQGPVDEVLNMMIVGIHDKVPALQEIFLHNALSWTGTKAQLLHYEDLVRGLGELDGDKGAKYFGTLLRACGIAELPPDWRQRVSIGADRKQSATARENLSRVALQVPETLPEAQRQLVDVAAPGLRAALGYKAGGAT